MKKPKIIGLTGNIGCGKSTVAQLLSRFPGVIVLDSDQIAKGIALKHANNLNLLLETDIFSETELRKTEIAKLIFSDKEKKAKLEAFLFPLVWEEIGRRIRSSPETEIFFIESALIYESGSESRFDFVIAATCGKNEQMRRLREIRGMTEEEIVARLTHQTVSEAKVSRAQFVIDTECDRSKLEDRVKKLYQKIKEMKP